MHWPVTSYSSLGRSSGRPRSSLRPNHSETPRWAPEFVDQPVFSLAVAEGEQPLDSISRAPAAIVLR